MKTDSLAIIEKLNIEYQGQIEKLTTEHKHYSDSIQIQIQKLTNNVDALSKSLENQLHVIDRAHEFYNIAWIVISALVVIFAGVLPWYLQKRSENKNDKMQNKLEADILTKNEETKSALGLIITTKNSETKEALETFISNKISVTKKTLENDISNKEKASIKRNKEASDKIKTDFENLEKSFNKKYNELELDNKKMNSNSVKLIEQSIAKITEEYTVSNNDLQSSFNLIRAKLAAKSTSLEGLAFLTGKSYKLAAKCYIRAFQMYIKIDNWKVSTLLNNLNIALKECSKEDIESTLLHFSNQEYDFKIAISDFEKNLKPDILINDKKTKEQIEKIKEWI